MTAIKSGDTVEIHYTGTLSDGSTFDTSRGRDPLEFVVGAGQVIRGLDAALPGMRAGESRTIPIPCALAYGPANPAARQDIPRSAFPDHLSAEPGTRLQMQTPDGRAMPVMVVASDAETVTLDANHPLAGKDLTFEVEIVAIRAA